MLVNVGHRSILKPNKTLYLIIIEMLTTENYIFCVQIVL